MKKLDKRLLRMVKITKGQYIAVLAIIITGIFVFTAMSNSATNLKDAINDYYQETNFADIYVQGFNISDRFENQLIGTHNIKQAEARIVFDTTFITQNDDENVNVRVISVDKFENKINKLFIQSGKRTLGEKEVIVIEQFATARNIKVGDVIEIKINGRNQEFRVSAIASSSEYIYLMENGETLLPDPEKFGVFYLEENYLRKIYGSKGNFNEILLDINSDTNIDKTVDYLKDNSEKLNLVNITKKSDQLSYNMLSQEVSGLDMMAQSVPVVFLVFAGIMLGSMLSRIVKKDRTSIGVLKALGFTDGEIIIHYLKYAASL